MDSNFVTVVSALPRSGTSLMMQALDAGGMPVLTDDIRKRDEDNPQGYCEFEAVKKTKSDPAWVTGAVGKAVKMVYQLLYDLPKDYEYRVIFMRRNMDEVLASQRIMLRRRGEQGADVGDDRLAELFQRDLDRVRQWLDNQDNMSVLAIDYNEMVKSPLSECHRVNAFLGLGLDLDKMASVVDPSLYRNKR
jgi:hypothetical protein